MTEFKICGLRSVEHALAAAEAGASFLGFVFVPGVRRQLTPEQAQAIIEEYRSIRGPDGPRLVGLFANQPLKEVNQTIKTCGLDFAQLCGDEPPDYWDTVDAWVIKQIRVRDDGLRQKAAAEVLYQVDEVVSRMHLPLLDRYEPGALGGTGRSFDWSIAADVTRRYDVLLAGGLTPDNVGEAITTASPWGVDVSSGVETDGVKDSSKISAFAEAVRLSGRVYSKL
jgi:phosphoribosylanthranilate isomerase